MTSAELTGWLAYLERDDGIWINRTAYATNKAFSGGHKQPARQQVDDDEPVIDTTDPNFVKHFKGFIQGNPPQNRPTRQTSTEIKRG